MTELQELSEWTRLVSNGALLPALAWLIWKAAAMMSAAGKAFEEAVKLAERHLQALDAESKHRAVVEKHLSAIARNAKRRVNE